MTRLWGDNQNIPWAAPKKSAAYFVKRNSRAQSAVYGGFNRHSGDPKGCI